MKRKAGLRPRSERVTCTHAREARDVLSKANNGEGARGVTLRAVHGGSPFRKKRGQRVQSYCTPSLHGRMETALEGLVVHDVDRAPPVRANGLMIRGREAAHDWQVIQFIMKV